MPAKFHIFLQFYLQLQYPTLKIDVVDSFSAFATSSHFVEQLLFTVWASFSLNNSEVVL